MGHANAIRDLLATDDIGDGVSSTELTDAASANITVPIDIYALFTAGGTAPTHTIQITDGDGGPIRIEAGGQNAGAPYIQFDPPIRVNAPFVVTTGTQPSANRVFYKVA